jgi:CheY-like chemotaxis protein
MNVFVSYQRADTLFAAHMVYFALERDGHDVFVDTGGIGRGELFRTVIDTNVAQANVVLALIGPAFDLARLREPGSVVAYEWQRARFHGSPVVPLLVDGGTIPRPDDLPSDLRWISRRNALELRRGSLVDDVATLSRAIPGMAGTPRRAARVLWVDDRPSNNEYERSLLRPQGIVFDNVVSTAEALAQLTTEDYDLVITDLGRRGSSDRSNVAGVDLLANPALSGGPPVVVYAGTWAVRQRAQLVAQGAAGVMADREELLRTVVELLGRSDDRSTGDLER